MASMQRPKIDDKLTLLADFGKTEAICVEVLDNPATEEEGILLKVMARGPFEQGQQVWIVGRDGSKVGATVENVSKQTIDIEVTLSTVLPA
jgi:hypothetical protein